MPYNVERMIIKPENLYERMANALIGKPEYSVQELEVLIEELLQLVEHHAPELHITEQQNIFNMRSEKKGCNNELHPFFLFD